MRTYNELKAQLNLAYSISVDLSATNMNTKEDFQKYISTRIDLLLSEIKIVRDSQTIFKSEQD